MCTYECILYIYIYIYIFFVPEARTDAGIGKQIYKILKFGDTQLFLQERHSLPPGGQNIPYKPRLQHRFCQTSIKY